LNVVCSGCFRRGVAILGRCSVLVSCSVMQVFYFYEVYQRDREGVWSGELGRSYRIDFVVAAFVNFFRKNIICSVTPATIINCTNSTLSNTPTSYLHNVSKQLNQLSGSISPKIDHRFQRRNYRDENSYYTPHSTDTSTFTSLYALSILSPHSLATASNETQ